MQASGPKPPSSGQSPGSKPSASRSTGFQQTVAPQSTHEQTEGLRAWIAQIERKLGVRSFAGGAAIVLALAAGIVGVVLAISAKDESATKAEVRSLRDQVSASTEEVSAAAQADLTEINERIDALESRVSTIASSQRTSDSELQVVQDDIDELRGQITDLEAAASAADSGDAADLGNAENP
jgi:uncharacterized protein HemX